MYLKTLLIYIFLSGIQFSSTLIHTPKKTILTSCPLHIIIAVDFSGSEQAYLDQILTVIEAITNRFELHETNLKIGIITFNRGARIVLPLTSDAGQMQTVVHSLYIPTMVYATDIHAAIYEGYEKFQRHSNAGIPKFFVLISDGDPHAHRRGRGFQEDLENIEILKAGNAEKNIEPVHVLTLYTGRLSPFLNEFGEEVRKASIEHMQKMASDKNSFFYFEDYPMMISYLEWITACP